MGKSGAVGERDGFGKEWRWQGRGRKEKEVNESVIEDLIKIAEFTLS